MKARLTAVFLLACLIIVSVASCGPEVKKITADEAIEIVMKDLGDDAKNAGTPHVHTGKFNSQDVYNVYLTVKGENWVFTVSTSGIILHKGPSDHSH